MKRPRILLDVDGPLTRGFFVTACALLREHGYGEAQPHTLDQWDIFRSFNASDEVEASVRAWLREPGVASDFMPNVGAQAFVAELQEWADVYAVTAPLDGSPTWGHDRETWLAEHFNIPAERVVLCRDKSVVVGDALVDDRLSYLTAWAAAHPRGLAVLWRESHNASSKWNGPSVAGYHDLRSYLNGLRG